MRWGVLFSLILVFLIGSYILCLSLVKMYFLLYYLQSILYTTQVIVILMKSCTKLCSNILSEFFYWRGTKLCSKIFLIGSCILCLSWVKIHFLLSYLQSILYTTQVIATLMKSYTKLCSNILSKFFTGAPPSYAPRYFASFFSGAAPSYVLRYFRSFFTGATPSYASRYFPTSFPSTAPSVVEGIPTMTTIRTNLYYSLRTYYYY